MPARVAGDGRSVTDRAFFERYENGFVLYRYRFILVGTWKLEQLCPDKVLKASSRRTRTQSLALARKVPSEPAIDDRKPQVQR